MFVAQETHQLGRATQALELSLGRKPMPEEIAQELSLTVSAVKSRLHRSRRALAGQWTNMQAQTAERMNPERMQHESPAF